MLGRVVLVTGAESFLAARAVDELVDRARRQSPDVSVTRVEATDVTDPGHFAEITGGSLFAAETVVVITGIGSLAADIGAALTAMVASPPADLALILVHTGGQAGKALVDKVRKAATEVVECQPLKAWELPQFVTAETRRAGGRIDEAAAHLVVDAVGHDLRTLAAAVGQLLSDSSTATITEAEVSRYFSGRAEVTSFAVADAVMSGQAVLALERLRWALATGLAPVLVTSAMAGALRNLGKYLDARGGGIRDYDLAREIGVPVWKLKELPPQARAWRPREIGRAIQCVALADAAIKGAATDSEFALEQMVIRLIRLRTAS